MHDLSLFSLEGSVALVTGASSGIGHEVAIGLAQAGAKVIAAARREDRLVSLVQKIEQQGGEALAVALDVTQRDSITHAFDIILTFNSIYAYQKVHSTTSLS